MIIPVRCCTCGKVLADKYEYYLERVREKKIAKGENLEKVIYLTKQNTDKTVEGEVLDALGLRDMCCRIQMLCHVDIE